MTQANIVEVALAWHDGKPLEKLDLNGIEWRPIAYPIALERLYLGEWRVRKEQKQCWLCDEPTEHRFCDRCHTKLKHLIEDDI